MSTILSPYKPIIPTSETDDFGITELASGGKSPTVDIVAIHGLDGHREASFTADNCVLWLRDLLPEALPSARILTYGYDGRTHGNNRSQQTMYDVSIDLVVKLSGFRINKRTHDRPLIFIAHGFGGIILKNALIHASMTHIDHLDNHKAVEISTYGMIFMGTPYQGVNLLEWTGTHVDGRSLESLQSQPLLKHLLLGSDALQQQLAQYNSISPRFKTVFCYEVYATQGLMGNQHIPASLAIVPGTVNAEPIAIYKTHIEMVKFLSKEDGDYKNIVFCLQQMLDVAPSHIKSNWMKYWNFPPRMSERRQAMHSDMVDNCRKISDWLAAPDPSENYSAARRLCKKGTGTWFTSSDTFMQWKQGAQPCLWIYGSMGSGKTILSSTIIMDVRRYCDAQPLCAVAYFYFDSRDAQEGFRLYHKVLRSIIKQLLAQCAQLPESMLHTYNNGRQPPEHDSLLDMVNHLLAVFEHVYIILDALDECQDYRQLLGWIQNLVGQNSQKIHILATTRPEIITMLESLDLNCKYMDLNNASGNNDIESYIQYKVLDSGDFTGFSENVRQNMYDTLCEKAKGMFQWVALQLDELRECYSEHNIEEQLENIPTDLYKAYKQVIDKISAKCQVDAMKFLQWLAFSFRPLKSTELREIPGINLDFKVDGSKSPFNSKAVYRNSKDILQVCSSFVVINEDYIKLAHISVKEYLMNSSSEGPPPSFHLEEKLSHQCMAQINGTHALFDYCAYQWISHYKGAGSDISHIMGELLKRLFLTQSQQFMIWQTYISRTPQQKWEFLREGDSPLVVALKCHLLSVAMLLWKGYVDVNGHAVGNYDVALMAACREGSIEIVQWLLKEGAMINDQPDDDYGTALIAACWGGSIEIVQLLLKEGANVNMQTGSYYGTALIAACGYGSIGIVQLLLKEGADIHGQAGSNFGSALIAACYVGNIGIVQLLLKEGADINAQSGGNYSTPLIAACCKGSIELVQLLLREGADIHGQAGGYCGSAFIAACCGGSINIIQLLLKEGADINAQAGGNYGTALIAACRCGSVGIVQLLLKEGADIHGQAETPFGSALIAACCEGNIELVQLLLKKGIDINAQAGGSFGTALIAACQCRNTGIVQLLLREGADINAQIDGNYDTALIAACRYGSIEIVQLLLKKGADIHGEADSDFGSALIAACYEGSIGLVQLLLKEGADINAQSGGNYGTPLIAACYKGSIELVELLLKEGADIHGQAGGYCGSAFIAACCGGSINIIQLLLKEGADINAQADGNYGTALIAACRYGSIEIVQLLLKKGADIHGEADSDFGSALIAACYEGSIGLVQLLLKEGADINVQSGGNYGTALIAACYKGSIELVELLLKEGADIHGQVGGYCGSAFIAACCGGSINIIQLLLKEGADINAQAGGNYGTALIAACRCGSVGIVQLLLQEGADIHGQAETSFGSALIAACYEGSFGLVQLLLKEGADINAQSGGNYGTPLIAACCKGSIELVELLLKEGADIHGQAETPFGSALIAACCEGSIELVQLLLKGGIDINTQGGNTYGTALIAACLEGSIEIVQLLLKEGADINAKPFSNSCTALIIACMKGRIELVQLLLKEGADINAQGGGKYGTPLIAACSKGSIGIVQLLLKEGADINAQAGCNHGTALSAACLEGSIKIVQLLLKEGAVKRHVRSLSEGFQRNPWESW
ncbi:ankyrin repeat-containing domain protein [Hysterangium stoloniferum]|nr:ankyrin repeat-containing domain protein [Hysterangium stoloniferum]